QVKPDHPVQEALGVEEVLAEQPVQVRQRAFTETLTPVPGVGEENFSVPGIVTVGIGLQLEPSIPLPGPLCCRPRSWWPLPSTIGAEDRKPMLLVGLPEQAPFLLAPGI